MLLHPEATAIPTSSVKGLVSVERVRPSLGPYNPELARIQKKRAFEG